MTKTKAPKIPFYDIAAGMFVTTLVASNIASIKISSVGSFIFDAGTILFPLAYVIGDVITEVYGYKRMRRLLYIGVSMLLVSVLTFWVVGALPAYEEWTLQSAYDSILGTVWRIVAASVIAITVGELVNSYILAALKIRFQGRYIWQRIIGSSVLGNFFDTVLFSLLAFAGTMSIAAIVHLIATVYAIKLATEIIVSPITVKIISWLKRYENQDAYEKPSAFLFN